MDPQSNQGANFEMPSAQAGEQGRAHEQAPNLPELAPRPQAPASSPSTPATPPAHMPQAAPVQIPAGAPQPQTASPAVADDIDLIEKEWVIKAKEIVNKTRHDPYVQNKEITKFKADYMKKRYNKDIKLDPAA
jgi:hypothetical protein